MEMDEISGYTEKGSLGLKTILTLVGEADIFVKSTIFRDWDLAPAMALAKRSGGFIGNKHGIPLTIGQSIIFNEGLIVSHDQSIANRISEEITTEQIFRATKMHINNNSKILIIAAHPDDEVLAMGGSIAKFKKMGAEITVKFLGEGVSARFSEKISEAKTLFVRQKLERMALSTPLTILALIM